MYFGQWRNETVFELKTLFKTLSNDVTVAPTLPFSIMSGVFLKDANFCWLWGNLSRYKYRIFSPASNGCKDDAFSSRRKSSNFYLPTFAAGISQDFLIMLTWASVRFFISGIGMFSTAMMRFWMLLMMFPIAIRPTQTPWHFWRKLSDHHQADALPSLSSRVVAQNAPKPN